MWYVLAAANALSGDSELIAGTQLRVPEVGVSKNDASTFKPYNPNEIIGSTSPGLPYIPPQSSNGCGYIITAVVLIAAAVFVPYLAPIIGPAATGVTAAGAVAGATLTGTAVATGLVTFAAHAAATAIGSAMGLATFSWRQSLGQGIAAGLTAGLAGGLGTTSELLKSFASTPSMMGAVKIAASAVGGAMANYAGNEIAGVKGNSFSWKSIAASAVANVVTAAIGNKLNLAPKYENGIITTGDFAKDFAYGAIGGVVSLHTRRAFGFNDKVDYGDIAANAFATAVGNAAGRSIVKSIENSKNPNSVSENEIRDIIASSPKVASYYGEGYDKVIPGDYDGMHRDAGASTKKPNQDSVNDLFGVKSDGTFCVAPEGWGGIDYNLPISEAISNEEFRNVSSLTQEQITAIISRKNIKLIDHKVDSILFSVSNEYSINPKILLATLAQEQSWGKTGRIEKLMGIDATGKGGTPASLSVEESLRKSAQTYNRWYEDGMSYYEKHGILPALRINHDPHGTERKAAGTRLTSQQIAELKTGYLYTPRTVAEYARLKYTPFTYFAPQNSRPYDTWINILRGFK